MAALETTRCKAVAKVGKFRAASRCSMAEHGRDSSAAATLFVHFGYFYAHTPTNAYAISVHRSGRDT